jgi:GNAT superfamily N-acetyltransferase
MVEIRPIDPGDADALVRFHHRLSDTTTRLRFFTFHPELSARELERFTHVDHQGREALVAVDRDEIRAVARYDRLSDEEVEFAVVVEDAWQGRGLGTKLFRRIADLARERGFARVSADTLSENRPMLDVFHNSGLVMRTWTAAGVVHVLIELDVHRSEVTV